MAIFFSFFVFSQQICFRIPEIFEWEGAFCSESYSCVIQERLSIKDCYDWYFCSLCDMLTDWSGRRFVFHSVCLILLCSLLIRNISVFAAVSQAFKWKLPFTPLAPLRFLLLAEPYNVYHTLLSSNLHLRPLAYRKTWDALWLMSLVKPRCCLSHLIAPR